MPGHENLLPPSNNPTNMMFPSSSTTTLASGLSPVPSLGAQSGSSTALLGDGSYSGVSGSGYGAAQEGTTLVNPSALGGKGPYTTKDANSAPKNSSFSFADLEGKSTIEQLKMLNEQLSYEAAIRVGAENMLNSNLNDQLRLKVQSALSIAEDNINSIKQRIELLSQSSSQDVTPPPPPPSSTKRPPPKPLPHSHQHSQPTKPPEDTGLPSSSSSSLPFTSASNLTASNINASTSTSVSTNATAITNPPPRTHSHSYSNPIATTPLNASTSTLVTTEAGSSRRQQQQQRGQRGQGSSGRVQIVVGDDKDKDRDEFRVSLGAATDAIRALVELAGGSDTGGSSTAEGSSSAGTGAGIEAGGSTTPHREAGSSKSKASGGGPTESTKVEDKPRIDALKKLVSVLTKTHRVAYELEFGKLVEAVLPSLSDSSSKQARALAYRAIRHALVTDESVRSICGRVQWYMVRTLARDNKHALEKEQAIKLVRAIVEASRVSHLSDTPSTNNASNDPSTSRAPGSSGADGGRHANGFDTSSSAASVSASSAPSSPCEMRGRGERGLGGGGYDEEGDSPSFSPVERNGQASPQYHFNARAEHNTSSHSHAHSYSYSSHTNQQANGARSERVSQSSAPAVDEPGTTVFLTHPVVRALVAVAEHVEDPFRPICVETLIEILLIDIRLMSETGGLRLLLHILGEGSSEMNSLLSAAFLHIVDSPKKRVYLRSGTDLEIALCAVTDAYGRGTDHADRMRACTRMIQSMLKTWSGLMYFCSHNMRAIRSLIDVVRLPSLETREIVLDMFFELFNIKSPEWFNTFISGRRLTSLYLSLTFLSFPPRIRSETDEPNQVYRHVRDASQSKRHSLSGGGGSAEEAAETKSENLKLTDQYIALLIMVFAKAGILEALTSMLKESTTGSNLSRKAILLMAEILHIANRVLPLSIAAKLQSIPQIIEMASNYDDGEHRIIGSLALSAIDSFNRNRVRLQQAIPVAKYTSRQRANSVEDAVRRGQRQVEQVKIKMGMQMDDKAFQATLLDTQVMLTKEHTKWNFEVLLDLVEGPLLNPKRMEEAIKVSRFVRRLMQFFLPFGHRFSDMKRTQENLKWVKLGCSLLTTLISSQEGIRYLQTEDPFLPQIVKSFAQLDPFNAGPTDSDPIFSKKNIAETLSYGYLEMLGALSQQKEGIELMEKFKIFTAYYHLSELRSREDLIKGIIENLDYGIDGHPRIVLSKALTSSYKHIRHYATCHLGSLIRSLPSANPWTLRLLLTQLYDPAPEVCEVAVQLLETACESQDVLQLVVEMQPTMEHLGELGHPLLMKFMSTPMGFRYLYHAGYVDREMDMWFHERNIWYAVQVEIFLSTAFAHKSDRDDLLSFEGTVPPHFYGQMAKTDLGCQILAEKGHFTEFVHFIRTHGHESEDSVMIMKLKSILWAVGNIGATEGGLPFLEENEIVPIILDIAETSLVPSVRGTCFFVLGLISTTSLGAEILDDYRWEATLSPLSLPTGLCLPVDLDRFITIPHWSPPASTSEEDNSLVMPTEQAEIEVMTAIQNLSNTVIANAASRSLAKMRSRSEYKHIFTSPTMFFRALHTISTQRYRLPVRRYVLDLFQVDLDVNTVRIMDNAAKTFRVKKATAASEAGPGSNKDANFVAAGAANANSNIVHIIPRVESDEEDEEDEFGDGMGGSAGKRRSNVAGEKLRPVSRIIGFAA